MNFECVESGEDKVRQFIETLSLRANYGIQGEKPLAVIAALQYVCEKSLEGTGFVELIESYSHSQRIRRRFIHLAIEYGRISNAENSWGVITGGSARELQRAAEDALGLDDAWSALAHGQVCSLATEFTQKLSEQASTRGRTV